MKANRLAMIFGACAYFLCAILLLISEPKFNAEVMFAASIMGGFIFVAGFISYVKER